MNNGELQRTDKSAAIEAALVGGDLSKLSPDDRIHYYTKTCESLGLNPLSKPFAYIVLNGKLTLYALRDATDQLRKLNNVSVTIADRQKIDDIYIVTARATLPGGRTDESTGAVAVAGLKGDNLANALMKAETKAKRRVTLSIVGLGMLDETEVESIPSAKTEEGEPIAKQLPKSAEPDNEVVELWSDRMARAGDIESLDVIRAQVKAEVTDKATLAVIAKRYAGWKEQLK